MKTVVRVFERVHEFEGLPIIDGCSLKVGDKTILEFTYSEGGGCESCYYAEAGFEFVDKDIAKFFGEKIYDKIPTSHLNVSVK